jgi:GNAT superfamily N-acetyltransferase
LRFDLVPAQGPILDEILTATFEVWHEGLSRRAYDRYYAAQLATPWGRSALRRWALVAGGAVLASAKVYHFSGVLDGQSIRIVGLGAVFTQPAHRGRGYARSLVDRVLDRASADGRDLALVFSEIVPDYYSRLE